MARLLRTALGGTTTTVVCARCRAPVASDEFPSYCELCFGDVQDEAISSLQSHLRHLDTHRFRTALELVSALERAGRLDEASSHLRTVLELAPDLELRVVAALLLAQHLRAGRLELPVQERRALRAQLVGILVKERNPISVPAIAERLGVTEEQGRRLIRSAQRWLRSNPHGLSVVRLDTGVVLRSHRGRRPRDRPRV